MQSIVLTRVQATALWLVVTNARPVEPIPIEAIDYALQHCTEYKYARTLWEFVEINHIQIKEEGLVNERNVQETI